MKWNKSEYYCIENWERWQQRIKYLDTLDQMESEIKRLVWLTHQTADSIDYIKRLRLEMNEMIITWKSNIPTEPNAETEIEFELDTLDENILESNCINEQAEDEISCDDFEYINNEHKKLLRKLPLKTYNKFEGVFDYIYWRCRIWKKAYIGVQNLQIKCNISNRIASKYIHMMEDMRYIECIENYQIKGNVRLFRWIRE